MEIKEYKSLTLQPTANYTVSRGELVKLSDSFPPKPGDLLSVWKDGSQNELFLETERERDTVTLQSCLLATFYIFPQRVVKLSAVGTALRTALIFVKLHPELQ